MSITRWWMSRRVAGVERGMSLVILDSGALEIAFEHADVDERRVGAVRPQVFAAEAHVVGGLVGGGDAMRVRIGERVGRRHAAHHPALAADIPRHAVVPGGVVEPYAHVVARLEGLALRQVAAAGRAGR